MEPQQPVRYLSTRSDAAPRRFTEILLEGLAPDGGLYLPTHYPRLDAAALRSWRGLSYAALAEQVLALFIDDIPAEDLRELVGSTYTAEVFGTEAVTPLTALDDGLSLLDQAIAHKREDDFGGLDRPARFLRHLTGQSNAGAHHY